MKKFKTIMVLILIATSFNSCNKGAISTGEEEVTVELKGKFIHFDTDIATRGTLIGGNVFTEDFAVVGYKYSPSNIWDNEKATVAPNVFYTDDTKQTLAFPRQVRYKSEGYYEYDNLQAWTGWKYAFFAYYPYGYDNVKLFQDGNVRQGEPYITYTLPNTSDPTQLKDIMTASATEVTVTPTVALHMRHRLSAVDIKVRNYCEYDHDSNAETVAEPINVKITKLVIKLKQIKTSTQIFLDHNTASTDPNNPTLDDRTFIIVDPNYSWAWDEFTINKGQDINITCYKDLEDGTVVSHPLSLLLIPQTANDAYLSGEVTLDYVKMKEDGKTIDTVVNGAPLEFSFNKKLTEGRRYSLDIAFTADAISLSIDPNEEWTDEDLTHDFE